MADETKHTPGPWTTKRANAPVDGAYDWSINADGFPVIAEAFGRSSDGGYPDAEANARLIAASPDLLEAAQKALNYIANTEGELGITLGAGDALRAAILKATGAAS